MTKAALLLLLLLTLTPSAEVTIHLFAFQPAVLDAAVGDTVVWTNHDIVPHTATGVGPDQWSTGPVGARAKGRYVVRRKGTVEYYCELHPGMRGRLIVR